MVSSVIARDFSPVAIHHLITNHLITGFTMSKLTIRDVDLKGKKVLVRVDYNVPLDKSQNITDDTRIKESLPTLKYLLEKNCRIILCSHLGRPKGKVASEFSLKPVAKRLSEGRFVSIISRN